MPKQFDSALLQLDPFQDHSGLSTLTVAKRQNQCCRRLSIVERMRITKNFGGDLGAWPPFERHLMEHNVGTPAEANAFAISGSVRQKLFSA